MGWHGVLLEHIIHSGCLGVHPQFNDILQTFDVAACVDPEFCFKEVWWHDISLTTNNTQDHDRTRELSVLENGYILYIFYISNGSYFYISIVVTSTYPMVVHSVQLLVLVEVLFIREVPYQASSFMLEVV